MNELDEVVFNEIVSDFASIVQEHGAHKVVASLLDNFPELTKLVYQQLNSQLAPPAAKTAALFKP